MKRETWRTFLAAVLCLLLPCVACAETLIAEELNEANALSALRKIYTSLMVEEVDEQDGEITEQSFWDGTTADGRSLQVMQQMENQRLIFVLEDTFYTYDMTQGMLFCGVWLPGSREALTAEWDAQLQIFAEDIVVTANEGDIDVAELSTMSKDGAMQETWQLDAATHALRSYRCEASAMDENGEATNEVYTLSVTYDAACLLPEELLAQISDETFTLTLVDEKGNATAQQLSINLSIFFTDGAEQLLCFRDADFKIPVDMLNPTLEDVTNGVTLYYSTRE